MLIIDASISRHIVCLHWFALISISNYFHALLITFRYIILPHTLIFVFHAWYARLFSPYYRHWCADAIFRRHAALMYMIFSPLFFRHYFSIFGHWCWCHYFRHYAVAFRYFRHDDCFMLFFDLMFFFSLPLFDGISIFADFMLILSFSPLIQEIFSPRASCLFSHFLISLFFRFAASPFSYYDIMPPMAIYLPDFAMLAIFSITLSLMLSCFFDIICHYFIFFFAMPCCHIFITDFAIRYADLFSLLLSPYSCCWLIFIAFFIISAAPPPPPYNTSSFTPKDLRLMLFLLPLLLMI